MEDASADIFAAEILEQRATGPDLHAPTVLVSRVTSVIAGAHVRVGDVVNARGDGNALKAPSALDSRITEPGVKLLLACRASGSSVEIADTELVNAAESCVALGRDTGTRDEIAARLASGLTASSSHGQLVRQCARRAVCRGKDAIGVIRAITRIAETNTGDPLSLWTLMDGLRVRSVNGNFAHDVGCPDHAQLTDPAHGADEANVAAVVAQLTLAAHDGRVTWLKDAQELMHATNAEKELVAKVPAPTRAGATAALKKLSAEDRKQVTALEALLSSVH